MEFKDNPLLRYHKDIEKAKPFMLSQYKKNCELEERQEEELLVELFGDDEDFEYLSYELYEKKRKERKILTGMIILTHTQRERWDIQMMK